MGFSTYVHVIPIEIPTLTIRKNIAITEANVALSLSDESATAIAIPEKNAIIIDIKVNKIINPICSKFNFCFDPVILFHSACLECMQ